LADVKWIKLVTDVFDDEKILMIETMPEADSIIVIWFKLLCLAGKQNNSGVFQMGMMPYTDEMFSTIFRRPLNTVRLALSVFEKFGMIEVISDTVTIPNWCKYQNFDQIESRNEYMKGYMKKYREKQKALADGNVNSKLNSKVNSKLNVNCADKKRKDKKEIRIEEDKNTDAENPLDVLPENVRSAFNDFAKMRKTKLKKPMTDNAVKRMLNKLNSLSTDESIQIAILNQSEDNCWLDIYPLKTDKPKQQKGSNPFLDMVEEGVFDE
jgi:predicted phage replisome organizer